MMDYFMIKKLVVIITLCLFNINSFADVPIMPLSEIKPGMRGTGKTVFAGNEIEEFELEVLDILNNFAPHTDIILTKLTSAKLKHTGAATA